MTSLLYRNARLYRAVLALLYGKALRAREKIVASLVPPRARVVDVCCGDGSVRRALKDVDYVGVDVSSTFVGALTRAGVEAQQGDVSRDDVPVGDVVLMLGALYQFLPDVDPVLQRLRRAARRFVVVAEPFQNLAQSNNRFVRALARRATDPGVASSTARFDETSLRATLLRAGATSVQSTGKELVAVLPGLHP